MAEVVDLALSVVVPVFEEEENIALLHPRIEAACASIEVPFEVVFVDDGSRDGTWDRLRDLQPHAGELVLVRLMKNCGQTAAMAAGFAHARGGIIVSMDGDLQNDPADIPALFQACRDGFDLVCGWRKDRKDRTFSRKLPSVCANWLIRVVGGVKVHDYGCTLKAYRRELVRRMILYSDMHRFLPLISRQVGARITELPVAHHARAFGRSKYGLSRIWKVLVDLLSLKVLVHYYRRLLLWFVLMSLPIFTAFLVLLNASLQATVERRQTLIGATIVVGTLAVFFGLLGLASELALKANWREFDRLLVVDDQTGETLA